MLHKGLISEESKAKREMVIPLELAIAANIAQTIPCLILTLLIAAPGVLSEITQATPIPVIKIPHQAPKVNCSPKKIKANKAVIGGDRVAIKRVLLAPIFLRAEKKAVSPKPIPIIPLRINKLIVIELTSV